MSKDRMKIIIEEIEYWKKYNLLPEQYCDYLLTLYTKGEEKPNVHIASRIRAVDMIRIVLMFFMIFLASIVFLAEIDALYQTILLITLTLFAQVLYIFIHDRLTQFPYALTVLLILYLLVSIQVTRMVYPQIYAIIFILFTNFIAWFVLSILKKVKYLKVLSIFAIILTVLYIFFQNLVT